MVPPPGDDPSQPPPPPGADDAAPPTPVGASGPGLPRPRLALWERIGGRGLTISLVLHGFLLAIFAFWVITTITDSAESEPNTFATGSGGGSKGEKAVIRDHKVVPRHAQNVAKNTSRITSKSSTASVALPDLPALSPSSMMTGMTAGGASKGFGGGSGGGIGAGKGVGVGNGRNFVGKPVMGARIMASRIAVYLDASGSMRPYLDRVEAEIRRQFPEADIFRYNGIWTNVVDNEVVGGRKQKNDSGLGPPQDPSSFSTDPKTLTTDGKAVFRRWDDNFRRGSVGAWLDVMMRDRNYDALVLFSDFQDGFTQYDNQGNVIFQENVRGNVSNRKSRDARWEQDWISTFAKAQAGQGPRLYCFTTQVAPQKLIAACVEVSGGEIKDVSWLRNGGGPPPPPPGSGGGNDPNAAVQPPSGGVAPPARGGYRPPR
jgi:hypothetical protein